MIINHNMMSMNAHRAMGVNSGGMGKSVEKLSSGLRINRAADDAAGLSISEKMRSQIRGMNQASRNAQDGISVVQTAEGALDEVHAMLQRMKELAVQSASDSNQSAVDREALQQEVNDLAEEINSISTKTQFNKMNLLDGSFTDKHFHVGANSNQTISVSIDAMDVKGLGLNSNGGNEKVIIDKTSAKATSAAAVTEVTAKQVLDITIDGEKFTVTLENNTDKNAVVKKINESIGGKGKASLDGDDKLVIESASKNADKSSVKVERTTAGTGGLAANIGETKGKNVEKDVNWKGVNVLTREGSNQAMTDVQKSIETLASRRAKLGAVQNRIEHTIKNLNNSAENLQAAESRVRDVDMAKQMSAFTKDNILAQASQAMLAQANQLPQQVLQLLR